MRLVYIYHSGYVIEGAGYSILIDYYKDTSTSPGKGYVYNQLLKKPGRLYILSSHTHPDHFNPEILTWRELKDDITYIFSDDILQDRRTSQEEAIYLKKGDSFSDEKLTIEAFGSTDTGISFLIKTGGKQIFHAGDLNNWHWKDESTREETEAAENEYLQELELLSRTTSYVDLAMFPVDPRLGSDFDRGAKQFIDRIQTGLFAPMHFDNNYKALASFKLYAESGKVRFANWKNKGDSIEF